MVKKIFPLSILVLLSSILFFSCDSFILGPSLNLNRDGLNESFGRFECELIDSDEIRVVWDWYDLERALRDIAPVYDEIVIKHSRGSYPTSRLGGESFPIKSWDASAKSFTSVIFSNLKRDREHYFALYAHEKGGGWMAPVYTSQQLENFRLESESFWHTNFVKGDMSSSGTSTNFPNATETISGEIFNILYYENWYDMNVGSAEINIDISLVPLDTTLVIHPMRARWESGDPFLLKIGEADEFFIDRSIRVEIPFVAGDLAGPRSIDISEVLAKAYYHNTGGLFLYTTGNQLTMNYTVDTPSIDVELVGNW